MSHDHRPATSRTEPILTFYLRYRSQSSLQDSDVARRNALAVDVLYSPTKVGLAVAGFDVPHAHLHIIPLHDHHDFTSKHYLDASLKKTAAVGLDAEAANIRRSMAGE